VDRIELHRATIVVRAGTLPEGERTAASMLVDEISKRCGVRLPVSTSWPSGGAVIAMTSQAQVAGWKRQPLGGAELRAEGYRLVTERNAGSPVVWITGADARGALFGAGRLLREIDWARGSFWLNGALDVETSPAYAIRGHQLGYRAQANSYDAWDPAQFEQYIRELTWFGANSIEGIPFQDDRPTPVMKYSRREMNKAIGEICHRYGLDYWLWLPADFDLRDIAARDKLIGQCGELYQDCPAVAGIFFPGGDPGNNPPELVLPFLEDLGRQVLPIHRLKNLAFAAVVQCHADRLHLPVHRAPGAQVVRRTGGGTVQPAGRANAKALA
jgi:hypothetical protein